MTGPHPLHGLPLLQQLSADARDELRLLLERAAWRQESQHQAAIEGALLQVPVLLRNTVRTMLSD